MGGGSKPSGTTTTTQTSEPWAGQKPSLEKLMGEANRLYGGGVGGSAPQYDQAAYDRALAAWRSSGGGGPTVQSMRVNPKNGQEVTYYTSEGREIMGRPGQYTVGASINGPSGPMPTLDQFAVPGTGGQTDSLLAPDYYPGQTIADWSPETLQAMALTTRRATEGSPVTNSAKTLLGDTLDGKYLDVTQAPGFRRGLEDITDAYRKGTAAQTDAAFGRAGAYGGSAHREMVADNSRRLADSLEKFAGDQYQQERNRQYQGMLFAPQMSAQDYADLNVLQSVGREKEAREQDLINADVAKYNYNAQLPLNALANYQGLVQGNYGGSQTTTQPFYSNKGAGLAGGLLGAASLASMFAGNPLGGMMGASSLLGGGGGGGMWTAPWQANAPLPWAS